MDFKNKIESINSKEDFINFLNDLQQDKLKKCEDWENKDIVSYLEGISSWVEDMDGYYKNMGMEMPEKIDWQFIATLFYVGKIYE